MRCKSSIFGRSLLNDMNMPCNSQILQYVYRHFLYPYQIILPPNGSISLKVSTSLNSMTSAFILFDIVHRRNDVNRECIYSVSMSWCSSGSPSADLTPNVSLISPHSLPVVMRLRRLHPELSFVLHTILRLQVSRFTAKE